MSPLPDAELYHLPGESHLGGLGRAEHILETMLTFWDEPTSRRPTPVRASTSRTTSMLVSGCRNANRPTVSPSHFVGGMNAT